MPRVLIFSLVFAPDGVSLAHIMSDLASDLQRSGNAVSVITAKPHHARDVVAEAAQPLRPRWGPLLAESEYHGMTVLHTWMPERAKSRGRRALGWLSFHVIGGVAALIATPRADVILVPSPLLTAGVVGWVIGLIRGSRYIYNVQDLYPDLAIKVGAVRNPLLIRILRRLERFVYDHAWRVTVIGESMERALLAKGVPAEKVKLIPNFVDVDAMVPVEKRNAFALEHRLADAFTITYAGNMGNAQGLARLLDAAQLLRDEPDIRFLFVGEGVLRDQLVQRAAELDLPNVLFLPHHPYATVPLIYGASDVCVLAMTDAISGEAIPSKVYRIMAAARPILALTDPEGDVGRLLTRAGAGTIVHPANARQIADAILALRRDPVGVREAGRRGREFVIRYCGRDQVTAEYGRLVAEASCDPGGR